VNFFANKINGNFLNNVLPGPEIEVDWIKAAIAYGSDGSTLVENSIQNQRKLEIWMRYDHTVPVTPALLKKLLKHTKDNIFCFLIPDVLHAKIIWWKGYGVYIGSANLTDRAWYSNIEFGVFLSEVELENHGAISEIEFFFEELELCPKAFPLNDWVIAEQEKLLKLRRKPVFELNKETEKLRKVSVWEGPAAVVRETAMNRHKSNFINEWQNGLAVLKSIADVAPQYRPKWLNEEVPAEWQADQFLHAYYYNEVVNGNKHPVEDFFLKHMRDPARATRLALLWWSELPSPPSNEDENCHVLAPLIRKHLSRDGLENMTVEHFAEVCIANHSTMDHIRRMTHADLGVDQNSELDFRSRAEAFARLLWSRRNKRGEHVVELIKFILDGGSKYDIASRVFEAAKSPNRRFSHLGPNQLAELAGWARPDVCPPRNGRTSKGLRALGYNVKV
jgi:hypothetical protein